MGSSTSSAERNGYLLHNRPRPRTDNIHSLGVFNPIEDVLLKEGTVVEVHVPAESPAKKPRSIGDTPFAGMWKDREVMTDSVAYINRLRHELHG